MAFTQVAVSGSYQTADGQPASGTVTFTLTRPIANGDVILAPQPVIAELDATGAFSVSLAATDDPGTVPQGVWYGVTEQLVDAEPRDYFIVVSAATNPVDISTLMPTSPRWV